MTTTKHRLFSALLSVFLIISLITPSVSLAQYSGDAGSPGHGGGVGEGDGGAPGGEEGGDPGGDDGGEDGGSDADADAEATADAAVGVSEAADIAGVDVTVGEVDANNVSVNGVSMSVDDAISAIGDIADAQAQGLGVSYSSNQPGVDVDATLSAHAMGDTGVVGMMSGEFGTVSDVAAAESEHAGRQAAVSSAVSVSGTQANFASRTAATPATDVNSALAIAMASYAQAKQTQVAPPTQSALMSTTPMAQQTNQLSTNLSNVNTSPTSITGVTPSQSFSTTNKSVDATSFSLGNFTPGQSSNPTAPTPNSSMSIGDQYSQAAFGTALGRLSSIKSNTENEIVAITKGVGYLSDAQLAQVAAKETQIAAIDARTTAMTNPTVTNQAVAALAEQKATEVTDIAETVATQEANGQRSMSTNTLASIQSRVDAYNSRISAAKASTEVAQTEVTNNSKLAAYDVSVALGNTTPPTSNMTAPAPSSLASIGIGLGLNPTTANAIAANVNSFVNAVVSAVPGLATATAVTNYTETKALSREVAVPAQEVVSALTAAGVANPHSFLSQDEKNQLSSANTLSAQAKALGSQAIGIAMMDAMGIATIGMASSLGKSAAQTAVSGRATTAASPVSKSITPTDVVSNATTNNVTVSYNTANNTFTVSTPPSVAGRVAQGRFSTTGQANTSSVGYRSAATENPASQAVTANRSTATSPSTAANTTATGRSTTAGRNSTATENPASQAVAAADNVPTAPNTTANTPSAGRTAASTENPASKAVAASDNPATPASLADNVSTPASAVDNSAVPGVTRSNDSYLGRTFTSRENPASRNITATVMALTELTSAALSPTSITSKSIASVADRVATAITRSADDIATTPTQTTVSVSSRSTTNVAPSNQVSVTPASATKAPSVTTPAVGVTAAQSVPTASVPETQTQTTQTATTPTSPTTQTPSTPGTTASQENPASQAVAENNSVTSANTPATPAATTPVAQAPTPPADIPSSPTNAQPTSPNPTAPSRGPVADTLSKIADGVGNALGELFGVKPAASKPTTVNFANLESTPATRDFVGVVPNSSGRFLEFADNTTAGRALLRDLDNKINDLQAAGTAPTLNSIIPKYSPPSDSNNPTQHANNIAKVVANDVPDFTANTPITVADLQGPVGVGLIKGFAQAEEGINLPTEEAAKGVAAYTAIPSVPTTLKNGVYSPTNPADQAQLDSIRNEPVLASSQATPQQATPAPKIVQDLTQIVRGAAELSPTVIAVRAAASFFDRALTQEAKQSTPTVQAPANSVAAPTVASPVATVERVVLANGGATRNKDLSDTLKKQITYAAEEADVVFVVTSGGQAALGDVKRGLAKLTERVGSTRHDDGKAADGYLKDATTGRTLDFTNPNDLPRFKTFIEAAVKAGVTGVGAGTSYMGNNKVHVGGGSALAWGKGGKVANAPGWLTEAHTQGLNEAKSFNLDAHIAAQQALPTETVTVVPVSVTPATTPAVTPATSQSAATPASSPSAQTPSSPTTATAPTTPTTQAPATRAPVGTSQGTTPATPGGNTGNPPSNPGNVGPGTGSTPRSLNAMESAGLTVYGAVAAVVAFIASVMSDDDESESEDETQITETTTPPTQTSETPDNSVSPASDTDNTVADVPANQVQSTNTNQNDYTVNNSGDSLATSSKPTVNVLIQVDGNTGDIYFDVDGVYKPNGQLATDSEAYTEIEPENEAEAYSDYIEPSIILDDQRQNVIYSDGTYAPVVIDGVWYESDESPHYVYTIEYYEDGELVETAENAGVLPEGNPLSNLLNSLFSDTSSYQLADIDAITRALIDPDSDVPADEYYIYRVYLKNGDVRGTTVPKYTSYRYMNERFVETGFVGNVLTLIAESVEIPPPSTGPVVSKVVETLKSIGLSALDLFRNNDGDNNPIVTDFGALTPSDDDEITMNDIESVLVLLDVEAECPFVPGLTRPYLYEIVIAQSAIRGATSDQAFRAVRCGGGDKQDFVDQVADHFETFDDVGTLDRQQLSEMIRFAAFQDLDINSLVVETTEETETASTSTTATVLETTITETESFKPNVSNEITFEMKAVSETGQTLTNWTSDASVSISSGSQLHFRWDGSSYQQCLPFLNDNGNYSLTVKNRAMTTGNTESEGYNITERSAVYRIECGGQRNNEFGVDDRSIEVIVQ